MNTRPRRQPPGGALHVAHPLTGNDATTLTLNVAEHSSRAKSRAERRGLDLVMMVLVSQI